MTYLSRLITDFGLYSFNVKKKTYSYQHLPDVCINKAGDSGLMITTDSDYLIFCIYRSGAFYFLVHYYGFSIDEHLLSYLFRGTCESFERFVMLLHLLKLSIFLH